MNDKYKIIMLLFVLFSSPIFSQTDSAKRDSTKFVLQPGFYSGQLEINLLFIGLEIGGQFDLDLYGNLNKSVGIGTRIGYQTWSLRTVSGSDPNSPYHSLNLFTRFSFRVNGFIFSILGGVSEYESNSSQGNNSNGIWFRLGFEVKYNMTNNGLFGLVIKGSSSKAPRSNILGFGIQIGFQSK